MGGVGEKIMVSAVTGVMNLLLGKLTTLIQDNRVKFKEARKQLELLMEELPVIGVALEKYAAMENPDMQMKAWMKDVRELAYDIEDCVDIFLYRVDHEPADCTTGIWQSISKKIDDLKKVIYRFKFADQIQALHKQANKIYELHQRYNIAESNSHAVDTVIDPRLSGLYVEAEKLVGIEGPSKDIIRRFILEDYGRSIKQRRVISIVGSGGLGKTTLANQVYKRTKERRSIECTAFVTVSRKPNMVNLLKQLISEFERNNRRPWDCQLKDMIMISDERPLIDSLKDYLQHKRYLIVFDDLWSASDWDVIQCALPRNNCGSRIIITTRRKDVARTCCNSTEDYVYEMKPLGEGDSKVLFLKRLLAADDLLPPQLRVIMNEILHKCGGLPLAIISIGSLLASKRRTKEEWEKVRDCMGFIRRNDQRLEVVQNILSIGYCDLPHHIKTCLLYLSIFPEDSEIDRDCLIWAWIAEGFIPKTDGYSLKEVGESYFNELLNRSMVQPVGVEYDGTARACRVHDVVLDFIISQSTEENFVTISHGDDPPSQQDKVRRLSLQNKHEQEQGDSAISWGTINLSHLRSFHLFGSSKWMPPLQDLQVLRVFSVDSSDNLSNIHFEEITNNSGQLRYLGLRNTIDTSSQHVNRKVEKLSIPIEKLEFLQMLDLRGTKVSELPKAIVRLKQLMCLVADLIRLPDGFGNMEALEELSLLDISGCSLNFGRDLEKLRKLRVLKVSWLPPMHGDAERIYMTAFVSSLYKLGECNLRSLHVKGFKSGINLLVDSWCTPPLRLQRFVMEGNCHYFSTFPRWIDSSLCNLTYLDIRVHKVEDRELNILKVLPGLLVLRISTPKGETNPLYGGCRIPKISSSGFQCLTEFCFENKTGHGVIFGEGAMPRLQMLDLAIFVDEKRLIKVRGKDAIFDFGLRNLSSIRYIKVKGFVHAPKDRNQSPSNLLYIVQRSIKNDAKLLPNQPEVEFDGGCL